MTGNCGAKKRSSCSRLSAEALSGVMTRLRPECCSAPSAIASALAHGYEVPEAVGFGKRWVTECLRAAYPLGQGHGPVSALFRLG